MVYSVRVAFVIKRLVRRPSPSVSLSCRNRESENSVVDVVERKGRVLLLRPRDHLDTFHDTFLRYACPHLSQPAVRRDTATRNVVTRECIKTITTGCEKVKAEIGRPD